MISFYLETFDTQDNNNNTINDDNDNNNNDNSFYYRTLRVFDGDFFVCKSVDYFSFGELKIVLPH